MKLRQWVFNAIIAALYVALTAVSAPLSFGGVQFRIAEILNHTVVFNRKYIVGILAGVFLSNLFFSPIVLYDIVFGVAHSLIALVAMRVVTRKTDNQWIRMGVNTLSFAFFSFIIAWELYLAFEFPFWFTYFTVALGEVVVMSIGMPIMKYLNEKMGFNRLMNA
ncbi:QueT transporter family protein [Atopococcus tabaci]|uniref:QueT transporter family protein n=1 Tax=Atopococcus tabaci TaxID=269774 RepID=UPI000427F738|nr:QueT transporter family protein [Atopococcus tabaci]